ncbi:MAG TPA: GNAT family N-acetyltransferase [Bryobacteraceae bacterium]|nr:GNAT family N-acetyltransferase [Bryobacteraceae bacterium]
MLRIRRGTSGDAPFLAWVMLAASRGHLARGLWDLIIGADETGCLEYLRRLAMAEPRSLCHYENFWIGEVNGQAASALCTFVAGDAAWELVGHAMASVQRDLGWTGADLAASQQRTAAVWDCFPPDTGADWAIESVATLPDFRRRGLVDALILQAIQEGVERGRSLAQITILIGNDAAQRAYEKAGFEVHDENSSPAFQALIGVPGFRRLLRKF